MEAIERADEAPRSMSIARRASLRCIYMYVYVCVGGHGVPPAVSPRVSRGLFLDVPYPIYPSYPHTLPAPG